MAQTASVTHLVGSPHPNTVEINDLPFSVSQIPSRVSPRLPPQSIQPNRRAGGAWDTWMVQLLCQGACLDLLPPTIHGHRLRQRRPPPPLHSDVRAGLKSPEPARPSFGLPKPAKARRRAYQGLGLGLTLSPALISPQSLGFLLSSMCLLVSPSTTNV